MTRECWFCERDATSPPHSRVVGLHKDVEHSPTWYLGIRSTWRSTNVRVPRCVRCRDGHRIEQAMMALSVVSLIAYAAGGQLDKLLGILPSTPAGKAQSVIWAGLACLPALVWIAVRQAWLPWQRLAPRRLRHARRHPEVQRLRADGWRYRPGPFPHWGNAKDPELMALSGPPARPRRIAGCLTGLLALVAFVVAVVLYVRDSEELAGLALLIAFGLLFLSDKINPGE
ncbi:hypothetical protein ABZ707_06850 [Streptomyces sp. NPDC006923]|uniref:hypothetical protein n=1 Tax=Streptomyces sp. NPDC006923 TaxID=3155355 RepID=UPI0033DC0086